MAPFVLHDFTTGRQRSFPHMEEVARATRPLEAAGHDFVIWSQPGRVGAGADVTTDLEKIRNATREINQVRGDFLAAMIVLEDMIEDTILYYIEPGATADFTEWVLSPMPFVRKLDLLGSILRKLRLWESYRKDWKTIDQLRVERNKMAHVSVWFLDRSFTAEDGNYRLRRGPSGRETADPPITMSELRDSLALAEAIVIEYRELDRAVTDAHTEPPDTFVRDAPSESDADGR